MAPPKRVCVVGAGPAGLVGAKVLHKTGQFHVTVYEKSSRIGGIWAIDQSTKNGWLSPDTPTNLSKFAVGFSDFAWRSSFLHSQSTHGSHAGERAKSTYVPMFPKAWQVNAYLEAYRAENLPEDMIKLDHKVVKAGRNQANASDATATWTITIEGPSGNQLVEQFDYLLVASGFFAEPRSIDRVLPGFDSSSLPTAIKSIHSSQYKSLDDVLPANAIPKANTILMIGGGNSSGEAAAAIAQHISDAIYSPGPTTSAQRQRYQDLKILHVTPRPLYVLPPYHPTTKYSPGFAPLDFLLYDLSKRPPDVPIAAGAGLQPPALKDMMHDTVQGIAGGNQSALGSAAMTSPDAEPRGTIAVALTESYGEFLRSKRIDTVRGRVTGLKHGRGDEVVAEVRGADGQTISTPPIAAVVYAAGFTPASALEWLPAEVLRELEYDPKSLRLPLILDGWQTMTKAVPDLALLGFYEGPYWGVMEMQARFTAARWLGETAESARPYEEVETLRGLRKSMAENDAVGNVPQYWFGDYLGYLEEVAAHLKLQRNDAPFGEREGCTSPARYLSADADREQATAIMRELHEEWQASMYNGKYVPRAVFRALQGVWSIHRVIDSKLSSFPSGVLHGTASFHPRKPTEDKSGENFDMEYLYIESGTLTMSTGAEMTATRRYVYRYLEAADQLSVWFVKPDSELEVDYLFHDMTFAPPVTTAESTPGFYAKADHLCVEDMYDTEYFFPMNAISLEAFETKHSVKGPQKDYVATTKFSRPQ